MPTNFSYEDVIKKLQDNHFYPQKEMTRYKSGEKITGLRVEAQPILQESKKARLEEVLAGLGVKVDRVSNTDYLLITKIKVP